MNTDKMQVFSMTEVGIAINVLYESWLGKYLKKIEWYDSSDDSVEDVLEEIKDFDIKYNKTRYSKKGKNK